jgi:flagellar export protein FliJ
MSARGRFAPLVELAQAAREALAQRLGCAERSVRECERLLELLLEHRREYEARYAQAVRQGLAPIELGNFHRFLCKLDAAIEQQRTLLAQQRSAAALRREEWRAADRKLKTYEKLEQRQHAALERERRAREQRELDEICARSRPRP